MIRLRAVALIFALAACGIGSVPDDASGPEIYRAVCANCHGDDLEGGVFGPSLGPGSNAASQPDSFIETTVLHGRGSMPSFRSTLHDAQLDRLIDFIREAQQG